MNDLVINHNGTPATTQNTVSELTDNNEQSVQRLIRAYEADLKEFGELEFKNELICNSKNKINYKKVYCLNEQQATLLLTYMKNTAKVREAKKILVKAFYDMRQKLQECQINGYKSQISQHNAVIASLKTELAKRGKIYDAEVIERYEQKEESLRAQLHNAKAERDFYFKRTQELKQKQNIKDSEIVRILNKIQIQMDGVYSEIGAVMAYANDNDRFFIEHNQFLKG